MNPQKLATFVAHESQARSYCRGFPVIFSKAKGSHLYDEEGQAYIDFLCGAGSLNYGHNNDVAKRAVLDYLASDSIMMSLDLHSTAKQHFIETFQSLVLAPRGLDYKMQFTSPTGTSVVESSIKLARKVTGRQNVIAFTNAYHGMTGVSLNLTGSRYHRQAVSHSAVTRLPYDGYMGEGCDTVALLRKLLEDASSGVDMPAAVILETIQGEGGLNVASIPWLQALRALTREFDIPLIVDDIQAGCGRSGRFFSFERAGIVPDMVCLSKSISGMGFPMALLLIRPDLDRWSPGEDNGTFRGNNIAFVAAAEVIKRYWKNQGTEAELSTKADVISRAIQDIVRSQPARIRAARGLGLMQGIEFHDGDDAAAVKTLCFQSKLLIETCGPRDQVLKIMPALTIERDVLEHGLGIIAAAVKSHLGDSASHATASAIQTFKALDALTEEQFIENYVRANKPVVVRDLGFKPEFWTPENLHRHLGVASGDDAVRLLSAHWRAPSFLPKRGMLMPAKSSADAVQDAFPYRALRYAAKGQHAKLHCEPFASDAVVCQFNGQQEVALFRPERAGELNALRTADTSFDGLEAIRSDYQVCIRPGEVLYIPHGWLYAMRVVEDSIAVSWNFVHESGAIEFIDYLMDTVSGADAEFEVLRHFYKQAGHNFASPRDVVRAYDAKFSELQDLAYTRARSVLKASKRSTPEFDKHVSTI